MLACCVHQLTDVLPIVGLSGPAVFLNAYKTPLLWVGIIMNPAGIVYLALKIRDQREMACEATPRRRTGTPDTQPSTLVRWRPP